MKHIANKKMRIGDIAPNVNITPSAIMKRDEAAGCPLWQRVVISLRHAKIDPIPAAMTKGPVKINTIPIRLSESDEMGPKLAANMGHQNPTNEMRKHNPHHIIES
jgi:hypothetical protein